MSLVIGGPYDSRSGLPGPLSAGLLGLADTYSERDLEEAILRELERFLLELGTDFSFIAREKRMTIGERDFRLDPLFYHRSLHRLVAIELKLGATISLTRARWSSICAGWTGMSAGRERSRPSG